MIAGLTTDYGADPAVSLDGNSTRDGGGSADDAAADATISPDAIEAVDASIPDDVVFADANDEPPPPADAACVNPTTCGKISPCCAPAVCSGANTCVKSCVGNVQRPCKTDLDCCQGLHCDENFYCVPSCVSQDNGDCRSGIVNQTCCPGLVCPAYGTFTRCQSCKNGNSGCQSDWECCSKDCQKNGRCK